MGHIPLTHTHSPTNHNPITSSHQGRSVSLNSNNLITSSHRGRSVSLHSNNPISSSHRGRSVSFHSNNLIASSHHGRSVSVNSNNPITSSHRGRSVSLNSNSTDSQCFYFSSRTLNPCSRSVSVNSDVNDSDSDFDMISNSERDCLFYANVVVDFFNMFEKCKQNETRYQTLLETLHQKILDQKVVSIRIVPSESVTDLYRSYSVP